MPVIFDPFTCTYRVDAATVETRADALSAEVRWIEIDRDLVEEVERSIRLASRTLGIDAPRVRWLPSDTKNIRGVTWDDTLSEISVRVQTPEAAKNTALHELKHIHQLRGDHYRTLGLWTMEQRQADADDFAASWDWRQVPAVAQPSVAHAQRSAPAATSGSERGRQIWLEKYAPLHEAARREVAERQARGRRR